MNIELKETKRDRNSSYKLTFLILLTYLWHHNFTVIFSLNLSPLQSETSLSWFEETPRDNTQDEQTVGADGELNMEIQGARVPEIKDKQSVFDYIF